MDNQQQQEEHDDNSSIAASDYSQIEKPATDDGSVSVQQEEQQQPKLDESIFNPNVVEWSTMDARSTIGDAYDYNELKLKLAASEAKNQMLEAKLEIRDLKEQNRAVKEESEALKLINAEQKAEFTQKLEQLEADFVKKLAHIERQYQSKMDTKMNEFTKNWTSLIKQHQKEIGDLKVNNLMAENKAFGEKLKDAEEKAKMATNDVKGKLMHKVDLLSESTILKQKQHQKEIDNLKVNNQKLIVENKAFGEKLKDAEKKAQMANNDLKEKLTYMHQIDLLFESNIQKNLHGINELGKEIATLKEQSEKAISWDQMDILWNRLSKGTRLANPQGMRVYNTKAKVSSDGFKVFSNTQKLIRYIFADKGFPISGVRFPIIYYFEVTQTSSWCGSYYVGLTDGSIPADANDSLSLIGYFPNSYAIPNCSNSCYISGVVRDFPISTVIKTRWNGTGDIVGCGLTLTPSNILSVFFTVNGILMNQPIPIIPSVNCLYPTLRMWYVTLEANFGEDPAKPFAYDIEKCPGMVFQ